MASQSHPTIPYQIHSIILTALASLELQTCRKAHLCTPIDTLLVLNQSPQLPAEMNKAQSGTEAERW